MSPGTVDPTASSSAASPKVISQKDVGNLGRDDFLKLLVAQLSNQDPLQPMDDSQFMGQLVQLNMLDQIQQMSQAFQMSQAASMIGRYVQGTDSSTGSLVKGVVDSTEVKDSKPYVVIGDKTLALTDVAKTAEDSGSQMLRAAGLIGKEVEVRSSTSEATTKGTVRSAELVDGKPALVLDDGTKATLSDLVSVVDPGQLTQATSFIGKSVDAISASGGTITGVVDRVRTVDGSVELSIGSNWVGIAAVTSVAKDSGA